MKSISKIKVLVAALAATVSFAAFGATIEYTTTQTVEEALTLTEDTTISVAADAVVTFNASISGDFKLTKAGAGELDLAAVNSFGSARIEAGILRANCNGALGSGTITIVGSTTATCRLDFGVMPAAATFANAFVLESASSSTYPAVRFWTDGKNSTNKTVTFTGSWTANGYLCFSEYCNDQPQSSTYYIFNCPVDVGTDILSFGACSSISWKGDVTAKQFYAPGSSGTKPSGGNFTSYPRGSHHFYAVNHIAEINPVYNGVSIHAENIFGGVVNLSKSYASGSATRGNIVFHADNTLAAFKSPKESADEGNLLLNNDNTTVVELTITGTPETVTQTCYIKMKGAVSLTLDAPDGFKQRILDRTHTTSGCLTVKRGTLSLEGPTTFASAQAVNVQGGTLDCLTTAAGCFASITNLTIGASGTLNFAATATTPVPENSSMDFEIATGATLTLGTPMTWYVRRFVVDGRCKGIDTWTSANCAALPEGLTVISSMTDAEEVEEIGWKGGAEDFAAASNWGKTGEPLDFTGNKYVATLAGDDATTREATVGDPVSLHGLVFAGPHFTLRRASDSAALSLFEAQLAFADDQDANEEPHAYTNEVPITFFDDAAINVPTKDTLTLGDITTTHGLDFTGKGTTYLTGDVQVDGPMKFRSGRVYLRGTIAAVGHVAQANTADVRLNLNYAEASMSSIKYSLVLDGGVIEKPIYAKAYDGGDALLMTTANTDNYITGPFEGTAPVAAISVGTGSTLTMSGGETFSWSIRKDGYGLMVITNKPFSVSNSGALFSVRYGTLRLDVAGNNASSSMSVLSGARLETTVDKAFSCVVFSHAGTADFKDTFQSVSHISSTSGSAIMTGEYGSCLMVSKGPAMPVGGTNVSCQVTGGLSLAMGGTGVLLLTNRVFTSCGDLTATNGVLELAANATWLNGTNFTARGTGTLKFAAAGQVNKAFAALHVADQGQIYVPEGVRVRFVSATLDEQSVPEGIYPVPAGTEDSTGLSSHITGGGSIRIKRPGTVLVVQ